MAIITYNFVPNQIVWFINDNNQVKDGQIISVLFSVYKNENGLITEEINYKIKHVIDSKETEQLIFSADKVFNSIQEALIELESILNPT